MEIAVKKTKKSIYLILVALIVLVAIAVGIYFLAGVGAEKEPNRGTFVMLNDNEGISL